MLPLKGKNLIVSNFFVIKPTRCTNFTNLFCPETVHVSDSSSVHHQEFIHCRLSSGLCHRFVDSFQAGPLLNIQWINSWWWTDELSKTCTVSWQNKFVKLLHLVGFITKKFVTMHGHMNIKCTILFFGPCIFIIEGRTDQRNAQINFSLINLLLFKLLRHVSAT